MFEAGKEYRFIAGSNLIPANPDKVKLIKKLDSQGTWKVEFKIGKVVNTALVNEWMLE